MNEIVIAPSILSLDYSNVSAQLEELKASKAKWLHFDVMDGVQSGRCHGLLAQPQGRQQKAYRGSMRRVRAGAGAEQCLLRAQLQLLRTLVLYAHPHPCRHDRERAGGPGC